MAKEGEYEMIGAGVFARVFQTGADIKASFSEIWLDNSTLKGLVSLVNQFRKEKLAEIEEIKYEKQFHCNELEELVYKVFFLSKPSTRRELDSMLTDAEREIVLKVSDKKS